jgi:hypothetical protein
MKDEKLTKKFVEHMLEKAEKKDEPEAYSSTNVDIDEIKKLVEQVKKKGTLRK